MTKCLLIALWFPVLCLAQSVFDVVDLDRGKALHDNHCVLCHESAIYQRPNRVARDYDALRGQVERWQDNTGLRWTTTEINNVTGYLTLIYYKYPLPATR